MTTWSLKMIRKLFQTTTLALLATAIGCGPTGAPAEQSSAIAVADLPPVAGCDSVKQLNRMALRLHPVDGVADLYLIENDGQALCIDSRTGARGMLVRLGFVPPSALAASNPMPGSDPNGSQDETSSNPMPGDPGNSNASSNPMPGQDHKTP
jgi:hypothetical protein